MLYVRLVAQMHQSLSVRGADLGVACVNDPNTRSGGIYCGIRARAKGAGRGADVLVASANIEHTLCEGASEMHRGDGASA